MRGRGSAAAAPRNGRTTTSAVTVPLRPGAQDRPAEGARSRGRRVPIEGVLLQFVLLAWWRPDDEDRKQLLLLDGTTRPTRRMKKKRRRPSRTDDQTNTPTWSTSGATQLAPREARDTSYPSYQEPRDDGCPQRSTGRGARRQESWGVAITVSRPTFASRPTKVLAPPRAGCVARGTTTLDCSQRISSVVTPNSRKSTSFQSKPWSPCTQRASRRLRALGGPPSVCTWVWFRLETNMPKMSPRELGSVDHGTAREICVRR